MPDEKSLQPVDYLADNEPWTQSQSNRKLFMFAPERTEIAIEDIARGLAQTTRFNRQCSAPYSVAQHCIYVGNLVRAWYGAEFVLDGYLHDAAEYAMNDVPTPNLSKPEFAWFRPLEKRWMRRIYTALDVRLPPSFDGAGNWMPVEVQEADAVMTTVEALALMPANSYWTQRADALRTRLGRDLPAFNGSVWSPKLAAAAWLENVDGARC